MKKNFTSRMAGEAQFNLTAMIDVVFLLIIFFMLICQFIVQENYRLIVPDDCGTAIVPDHQDRNAITVSVFPQNKEPLSSDEIGVAPADLSVLYAVRARRYDPQSPAYKADPEKLWADMTEQIIAEAARKGEPLVYLRADKDMTYADVQEALLALARAKISKVHLAAFRSDQSNTVVK